MTQHFSPDMFGFGKFAGVLKLNFHDGGGCVGFSLTVAMKYVWQRQTLGLQHLDSIGKLPPEIRKFLYFSSTYAFVWRAWHGLARPMLYVY